MVFKNSKITKLKILFLALAVLVVVFFARNYTLALTPNSSQTAAIYGPSMNTTLKTGLVGWWTMDGADTTANTTTDKSGQGNNGARTATTVSLGKIGQAMKFAGSGYLKMASSSTYNLGNTATINFWVKFNSLPAGTHAIMELAASQGDYGNGFLFSQSGSSLILYYKNSGAYANYGNTFLVNKWYHIVTSINNGTSTAYINGIAKTPVSANVGTITSGNSLYVGGIDGTWGIDGVTDDVRIYNRALSAIEITALYKFGQNKMASSQTAVPTTGNTLKTGLVGWWTMDGADLTANTTTDKAGTNNATRNTTTLAVGKIGQAMSFNGTNSYLEAPYSANLNPDTFTVAGWAKVMGGQGTFRSFVTSRKVSLVNGYIIYAAGDNHWQSWIYNSAGGASTLNGPNVQIGKWVYVVTTYDGSVSRFYVNNILYDTSAPFTLGKNTTKPIRIGAGATESATPDFYFNGQIDDVRIYNRALSASEITALYKLGQEKIDSSQTAEPTTGNNLKNGLVGWWTMDGQDVNATQALDKSGLGNTGTRTAVTPVVGKIGQAVKFNGATSRIDVGQAGAALTNNFTLSAWFKTTDTDGASLIARRPSLVSTQWDFYVGVTGKLRVYDGVTEFLGVKVVNDGKWHLGTFVIGNGLGRFYVDGLPDGNAFAVSFSTASGNTEIGSTLNGNPTYNAAWMTGPIDDVRIYNRALSVSEIQELYKMGR